MSPKRAALPGKDALFGPPEVARAESPLDRTGSLASEVTPVGDPSSPVLATPNSRVATPEVSRHVQLCVWIAPQVADEVDRARARLLMEHGMKVTKSEIVEAILSPALPDLDTLCRLLAR